RQDIYRVSEALVEQFIAGFASPPKSLILDLDHSEDACYGQQPPPCVRLLVGCVFEQSMS
ncbi:transposase, partial [Massilia genomosp. 1]|uniref:transposase n=1 Tax=Massilia genomosp. 1 TaxID=2609280 RepID=UPI001C9E9E0A